MSAGESTFYLFLNYEFRKALIISSFLNKNKKLEIEIVMVKLKKNAEAEMAAVVAAPKAPGLHAFLFLIKKLNKKFKISKD